MARGINKVILVGNLGADPESRYMPSGGAVCNLRIATTESWKDKQTGDRQEKTEWHNVVMFGRLAEIGTEYLKKGRQIYVEGRLQTRKWQGQDGQDRYTTEIVANEMQMLGGGGGSGGGDYGGGGGGGRGGNEYGGGGGGYGGGRSGGGSSSEQAGGRGASPQGGGGSQGGGGQEPFDDDIPF